MIYIGDVVRVLGTVTKNLVSEVPADILETYVCH